MRGFEEGKRLQLLSPDQQPGRQTTRTTGIRLDSLQRRSSLPSPVIRLDSANRSVVTNNYRVSMRLAGFPSSDCRLLSAAVLVLAERTIELAGPEAIPLAELARRLLTAKHDKRQVVADVKARYFGSELNDRSLTPGDNPRIGPTRFEEWLNRQAA